MIINKKIILNLSNFIKIKNKFYKFYCIFPNKDYNIFPILISFLLLSLLLSFYYLFFKFLMFFFIFIIFFILIKNIINKSYPFLYHNVLSKKNFKTVFFLFLIIEIMLVFCVFFIYIYTSINPSIWIGGIWPPEGIVHFHLLKEHISGNNSLKLNYNVEDFLIFNKNSGNLLQVYESKKYPFLYFSKINFFYKNIDNYISNKNIFFMLLIRNMLFKTISYIPYLEFYSPLKIKYLFNSIYNNCFFDLFFEMIYLKFINKMFDNFLFEKNNYIFNFKLFNEKFSFLNNFSKFFDYNYYLKGFPYLTKSIKFVYKYPNFFNIKNTSLKYKIFLNNLFYNQNFNKNTFYSKSFNLFDFFNYNIKILDLKNKKKLFFSLKNSLFFNFINLNKFNDLKIYNDFNKNYNKSFFYNFLKENENLLYIINLNEKNILKHKIIDFRVYLNFFENYFIFNNIQDKNFLIKKNYHIYFLLNYLINYEIKINKKFNYEISYEKIIKDNYFSKKFLLNNNYYWKNLIDSLVKKEIFISYYKENIFNSNKRIYYYMKFFFFNKNNFYFEKFNQYFYYYLWNNCILLKFFFYNFDFFYNINNISLKNSIDFFILSNKDILKNVILSKKKNIKNDIFNLLSYDDLNKFNLFFEKNFILNKNYINYNNFILNLNLNFSLKKILKKKIEYFDLLFIFKMFFENDLKIGEINLNKILKLIFKEFNDENFFNKIDLDSLINYYKINKNITIYFEKIFNEKIEIFYDLYDEYLKFISINYLNYYYNLPKYRNIFCVDFDFTVFDKSYIINPFKNLQYKIILYMTCSLLLITINKFLKFKFFFLSFLFIFFFVLFSLIIIKIKLLDEIFSVFYSFNFGIYGLIMRLLEYFTTIHTIFLFLIFIFLFFKFLFYSTLNKSYLFETFIWYWHFIDIVCFFIYVFGYLLYNYYYYFDYIFIDAWENNLFVDYTVHFSYSTYSINNMMKNLNFSSNFFIFFNNNYIFNNFKYNSILKEKIILSMLNNKEVGERFLKWEDDWYNPRIQRKDFVRKRNIKKNIKKLLIDLNYLEPEVPTKIDIFHHKYLDSRNTETGWNKTIYEE